MSRVEIASQGWGWVADARGNGLSDQPVTLKTPAGATAVVYDAITGGAPITPLKTRSDGTVPGFVDEGDYDFTSGPITRRVPAVSGSVATAAGVPVEKYIGIAASVPAAIDLTIADATAAGTAGGRIFFQPGKTYDYGAATTPPKILRNLPSLLTVDLNGATLKVSATCPRHFDFGKVADYDTFQKITFENGVADCNNVGGQHHILIGTYINGALQTRINLREITIRKVKITNAPVDPTKTNHRLGIWFQVQHAAAGETQTTIEDVLCEDVTIEGGNAGIAAMGYVPTPAAGVNIYMRNVEFRRCSHDMGSVQSSNFSSSNFQIGSFAWGDDCRIIDCYGYGSGDVGIEVDSLTNIRVEGCVIEEAFGYAYFFTNFNYPGYPGASAPSAGTNTISTQQAIFERCVARRLQGTSGWGFQARRNLSIDLGEMVVRDCEYHRNTADIGAGGEAVGINLGTVAATMVGIRINGLKVVLEGINVPGAAGASTTSLVNVQACSPTLTEIRRVSISFKATNASASGQTVRYIDIGPSFSGPVIIDEPTFSVNLTGWVGGHFPIALLQSSTTIKGGRLRGLRIAQWANVPGASNGVIVGGTANVTFTLPFWLQDCDFSGMTTGTEVVFQATSNAAKVFYGQGMLWKTNPPATAGIAPGGSPYTYQNLDGYREDVIVQGGTVTKIEYSRDNATFYDVGLTAGKFPVDHGDYLRTTYTVIPTMTKVPAK